MTFCFYINIGELLHLGYGFLKLNRINSVLNLNNLSNIGFGEAPYNQYTHQSSPLKNDSFEYSSKKENTGLFSNPIKKCITLYSPSLFLNQYMTEKTISNAIASNPRIKELLSSKGLEAAIYMQNLDSSKSHFIETYDKAKALANRHNLKDDDLTAALQGALLHDIGKVFIPPEILNKPSELTPDEKAVVDLHTELGAEILQTTDLSAKTIEAVRLHHTSFDDVQKAKNLPAQIVSVADSYSALKEDRPYKPKMDDQQAKQTMQKDKELNQQLVEEAF